MENAIGPETHGFPTSTYRNAAELKTSGFIRDISKHEND